MQQRGGKWGTGDLIRKMGKGAPVRKRERHKYRKRKKTEITVRISEKSLKELGMVAHTLNSNSQKKEAGRSQSQPGLLDEF